MIDTLIEILNSDPDIDNRFSVIAASYISENIDREPEELAPDYIKKLIFPDKKKIEMEKQMAELESKVESYQEEFEKQRVEDIRKGHSDALFGISNKQNELRGETDTIRKESRQFNQKLSVKQTEIEKRLEAIKEENQDLLSRQMEIIKEGEREMAANFSSAFENVDEKIPTIVDELKSALSQFEDRIAEQRQAEIQKQESEKPPDRITEQVLIEETGQIIEIVK